MTPVPRYDKQSGTMVYVNPLTGAPVMNGNPVVHYQDPSQQAAHNPRQGLSLEDLLWMGNVKHAKRVKKAKTTF